MSRCSGATAAASPIAGGGSTNARSARRRSPAPPFRSTATRPPTALGFDRPAANSLDAVSDRDFALEFLAAAAIAGMHLSRFAEEIVIWTQRAPSASSRLSDAFTTGSSIMPQKRNPDAAELVRAKTGRLIGALVALLTVMKGLPLAYGKDMQEDKVPVFEAADTLELCLAATAGMVRDMRADRERMRARRRAAASAPRPISPTGWCARSACRSARRTTSPARSSSAPKRCGCTLAELPLAEMQARRAGASPPRSTTCSTSSSSVASRTSFGGTAPAQRRAPPPPQARKRFLEDDDDALWPRRLRASLALVLLLAPWSLPLAACGKKGAPDAAAGRAEHLSAELPA